MHASELAALVDGALHGEDVAFVGVAPAERAGPTDLAFVEDGRPSSAGVLLAHVPRPGVTVVVVENARLAFAHALQHLFPPAHPEGVLPGAFVHPTARLGAGVTVYPGAYVGPDCVLGDGVVIHANAVLYPGVRLGEKTIVHAGAVMGCDGFSYVPGTQGLVKMPQLGGVEVGAGVEIGANACIDRGALDPTRVGAGTKVDDLVLIGHNAQVGRSVVLAGQVGLAGSTTVGDGSVLGGQAGTADHVEIGSDARIGAGAGVRASVSDGQTVLGRPAAPAREMRRVWALLRRLPEIWTELRSLRRRVEALEGPDRRNIPPMQ